MSITCLVRVAKTKASYINTSKAQHVNHLSCSSCQNKNMIPQHQKAITWQSFIFMSAVKQKHDTWTGNNNGVSIICLASLHKKKKKACKCAEHIIPNICSGATVAEGDFIFSKHHTGPMRNSLQGWYSAYRSKRRVPSRFTRTQIGPGVWRRASPRRAGAWW